MSALFRVSTSYKYQSTLDDVQSARTITLAFILYELFPLEHCPSQNRVRTITGKPFKLSLQKTSYEYQSTLDEVQSARIRGLVFIRFLVITLGSLSITRSCPLYNLKTV